MTEKKNVLKSKLPETGTTIFSVMSKLAADHGAINLSQGFPDFDVDPQLIELVHYYMKSGKNQYAPMPGLLQLRESISEKLNKCYNVKYNPDTEINITAGATQAIFTVITTVIQPGEEVIIFEPAYDCYSPAVIVNGGIPVFIQLDLPEFKINWEKVNQKINDKTRLIIINNPNNPAGSVLSAEDLENLNSLISGKNIFVLSDEVYEHILFDNHIHHSLASHSDLSKKSFIVFSFGKTFHATGWKVGYCLSPEKLMNEFRKVHQFNVFCVNTPMQFALADYLKEENNYMSIASFYEEKRNLFLKLIKDSNFIAYPSKGTYFQILDYSNISNETDVDFSVRLTKEYGVASVPVSAFYHNSINNKLLRFCFAKKNETINEAALKLTEVK